MKKLFLLFSVLSLTIVGCSKNDSLGSFDYDTELLFGGWMITHLDSTPWNQQVSAIYFHNDGRFYCSGGFFEGNGTYKLSGKRITCYINGKAYRWYDVISLDGKTCSLLASDDTGSITVTCKKI